MVLNPRKCEFMTFGKTNENEVFTDHKIRLKKLLLRNYLSLQQTSFSTSTDIKQMYARVLAENLMHYRACLLYLVFNRKGCVKLSH